MIKPQSPKQIHLNKMLENECVTTLQLDFYESQISSYLELFESLVNHKREMYKVFIELNMALT